MMQGAGAKSTWEEQGALLELENFARGLSAPSKEDPGGKAYARSSRMRGRAMSPTDAVRLALGFAFAGITIELADAPTATLPLSVASRNNGALAARLNDLLAASRAASSRAW